MNLRDDSEELLVRSSGGDEVALEALLQRHLPGVRAFIRLRMGALLRRQEESVDLAQSVCREILQHAERLQHGGEVGFKRWLYRTAARKISDHARHYQAEKRDVRRDERGDGELLQCYQTICTPSMHAAAHEELERIETAFEQLPEHYREVILGARILGLSHRELAEQMGRSEESVRVLLFRGLKQLAKTLE